LPRKIACPTNKLPTTIKHSPLKVSIRIHYENQNIPYMKGTFKFIGLPIIIIGERRKEKKNDEVT